MRLNKLSLILLASFACASVAALAPIGPGRSMLWGHYNQFAACYTWFAAWQEELDDIGNKSPRVLGQDSSGCGFDPRRISDAIVKWGFTVTRPERSIPDYHFQTANFRPEYRGSRLGQIGFDFDIVELAGTKVFHLYNNGQSLSDPHDFCRRQSEVSLSFFKDQFLRSADGQPYQLKEFTKLRLDFDARVSTFDSVCPDARDKKAIFKPSILFEEIDQHGHPAINAIVIALDHKIPSVQPPGQVIPEAPEVLLYNHCNHPEFDLTVCTLVIDGSVLQRQNIGGGWFRYHVDLLPLINRYVELNLFRSPSASVGNNTLRALQFIATQQGGRVDAKIKNINLRAAR